MQIKVIHRAKNQLNLFSLTFLTPVKSRQTQYQQAKNLQANIQKIYLNANSVQVKNHQRHNGNRQGKRQNNSFKHINLPGAENNVS